MLRDEPRVASRRSLDAPCLVVAAIAGPLHDWHAVIERPLGNVEALLTVSRDELEEARDRGKRDIPNTSEAGETQEVKTPSGESL